eukprot:4741099-Karenia_brevis.AAC.1
MREAGIPAHHGAKSRWILQGYHDPDITILNRSVPTPETSDPASVQRHELVTCLFATPPPGGVPGEDDDVLVEIRADIYGLILGPPGWRR